MKIVLKKVVIALISVLFLVSLVLFNNMDMVKDSSDYVSINSNGISVRMLSVKDNSYGEKDQTFTYSIMPENATEQGIFVEINYVDGEGDCSSVMDYVVNEEKKEVTLSCKGPFSTQIEVKLISKDNEDVTASIVLNYVKKVVGYKKNNPLVYGEGGTGGFSKKFDSLLFVEPSYSVYTKDRDYTFETKVNSIKENIHRLDDSYCNFEEFDSIVESIRVKLESKIENGESYFTSVELWNMSASMDWHNLLTSIDINVVDLGIGQLVFDANLTISCVEEPSVSYTDDFFIICSLAGHYNEFFVKVDSISPSKSVIDF